MRAWRATWKRWLLRGRESRPGPGGMRTCAAWSTTAPGSTWSPTRTASSSGGSPSACAPPTTIGLGDYLNYLARETGEMDRLLRCLTIHVSSFFRNASTFEAIRREVFPRLFAPGATRHPRFWSVGCSRGEEPYSLAILAHEHLGGERRGWDVQIQAVDIDDRVLAEAKLGEYGWHQVADLDPARRERYFEPRGALAPRAGDPPDGALSPPRHPDGPARRRVRLHPLPQPADLPRPAGPGGGARALRPLPAARAAFSCSGGPRSSSARAARPSRSWTRANASTADSAGAGRLSHGAALAPGAASGGGHEGQARPEFSAGHPVDRRGERNLLLRGARRVQAPLALGGRRDRRGDEPRLFHLALDHLGHLRPRRR